MKKEFKLTGQRKELLEYLQTHGSITNLEGFKIGIGRTPSRISELRQMGYVIEKINKPVLKANGKTAYVAEYRLVTEDE